MRVSHFYNELLYHTDPIIIAVPPEIDIVYILLASKLWAEPIHLTDVHKNYFLREVFALIYEFTDKFL